MRNLLKTTTLLAVLMVGAASAAEAQVSFGVRIGPPPPPRVLRFRPPPPRADFVWIDGYWYPVGSRYRWHDGYWARPPYRGAHWIGPRHDGVRFYRGRWDGERRGRDYRHYRRARESRHYRR
jgi:hypothetical protein